MAFTFSSPASQFGQPAAPAPAFGGFAPTGGATAAFGAPAPAAPFGGAPAPARARACISRTAAPPRRSSNRSEIRDRSNSSISQAFGAAPAPAFGGGAFGGAPAPAFGGAPAPAYGAAAPAPAFGAAFGGAPATPAGQTTLFGASSTSAFAPAKTPFGGAAPASTGGIFGSAPAPAASLFGQSPTTPGFGAAASPFGGAAKTSPRGAARLKTSRGSRRLGTPDDPRGGRRRTAKNPPSAQVRRARARGVRRDDSLRPAARRERRHRPHCCKKLRTPLPYWPCEQNSPPFSTLQRLPASLTPRARKGFRKPALSSPALIVWLPLGKRLIVYLGSAQEAGVAIPRHIPLATFGRCTRSITFGEISGRRSAALWKPQYPRAT